jgi:hypothetical protein
MSTPPQRDRVYLTLRVRAAEQETSLVEAARAALAGGRQ